MPTYPFWCDDCESYVEEIRSMHHASDECVCERCAKPMRRIYTAPQINMPVPPEGYYNHGLGLQVNSKDDIKEYKRRYEGATGKELIEVGNEKVKPVSQNKRSLSMPDEVVQHMASESATVESTKRMLEKVEG